MKRLLLLSSLIFSLPPINAMEKNSLVEEVKKRSNKQPIEIVYDIQKETVKDTLLAGAGLYALTKATTATATVIIGGCTTPLVPVIIAGGLTLYAGKKTYDYFTTKPVQGNK